MTTAGVYMILNIVNGKCYIGSSVDIERRLKEHWDDLNAGTHMPHFQSALRKYGEASFRDVVLETGLTITDLLTREQDYLDLLRTADPEFGYNTRVLASSNLGIKLSPEACARRIGRRHTIESRTRMSVIKKGKVFSPEHRARIAAAQVGTHHTPETRAKISAANTGKKRGPHSIETRAKIGITSRGRRHTPEACTKMSESTRLWWVNKKQGEQA